MRFLFILFLLISCGKQVKYEEKSPNNSTTDSKLSELENTITSLESKLAANDEVIQQLLQTLTNLEADNVELSAMIETLQEENNRILEELKNLKKNGKGKFN